MKFDLLGDYSQIRLSQKCDLNKRPVESRNTNGFELSSNELHFVYLDLAT